MCLIDGCESPVFLDGLCWEHWADKHGGVVMYSYRLPRGLLAEIKMVATRAGLTLNKWLTVVVSDHLEDLKRDVLDAKSRYDSMGWYPDEPPEDLDVEQFV